MNRNKEGEIESLHVLCLSRYSSKRKSHRDCASYGISRLEKTWRQIFCIFSLLQVEKCHNLPEIKLDSYSILLPHLTTTVKMSQAMPRSSVTRTSAQRSVIPNKTSSIIPNRDLTSKNRHRFQPNASHSAQLTNRRRKEASWHSLEADGDGWHKELDGKLAVWWIRVQGSICKNCVFQYLSSCFRSGKNELARQDSFISSQIAQRMWLFACEDIFEILLVRLPLRRKLYQ